MLRILPNQAIPNTPNQPDHIKNPEKNPVIKSHHIKNIIRLDASGWNKKTGRYLICRFNSFQPQIFKQP